MISQANIEFLISIGIFIISVLVIVNYVVQVIPSSYETNKMEKLENKAYQISEILMFTEGWPANWDSLNYSNISYIGIGTNEKYILNKTKILKLTQFCSENYSNISEILTQNNKMYVEINITQGNNTIGYCYPHVKSLFSQKSEVIRFGLINDNLTKIKIGVSL